MSEPIVGKIAVKVTPDTSKFKDDLKEQLEKIEKSIQDMKVEIKPVINDQQVKAAAKKAKAVAQKALGKGVLLKVNMDDQTSIKRAVDKLKAHIASLKETTEIELTADISDMEAKLADLQKQMKLELEVDTGNTDSIRNAIRQIDAELKKLSRPDPIVLDLDSDVLEAKRAELQKILEDAATITLHVDEGSQASVERAISQIKAEIAKRAEIPVDVKLNDKALKDALDEYEQKLHDIEGITISFDENSEKSLEKALAQINAELAKQAETEWHIKLNNGDLDAMKAQLEAQIAAMQKVAQIDLAIDIDMSSIPALERALKTVEKELEALNGFSMPVDLDTDSLEDVAERIRTRLAEIRTLDIRVDMDNNKSIEKAIAQIDEELAKLRPANISVQFDEASLEVEKKRLEQRLKINAEIELQLKRQVAQAMLDRVQAEMDKVKIRPFVDKEKLAKSMEEIEAALIEIEELRAKITPEIDPLSKRKIEAEIADLERKIANSKADIKATWNKQAATKVDLALAILSRTRDVTIRATFDNAAANRVGLALAQLSGGRIWQEKLREVSNLLNNFDKYVPKVAAVSTAMGGIASFALTGAANVLALGQSLASIAAAGLALPGIVGGMAVGLGLTTAALKDFNTVIPEAQAGFAALQDAASASFWAEAEAPIRNMVNTLLPQFTAESEKTSSLIGTYFGSLADEVTAALGPRLSGMFENLNESIRINTEGTSGLANILGVLGTTGSEYLPRLATWFKDITLQFSDFLTKAEADGSLQTWIDNGIQALKDLGGVIAGVFKIFAGLSKAATEAGGSTLGMLRETVESIAAFVNSPAVQEALVGVFGAAFEAMNAIGTIAGPALIDLFFSLGKILESVLPIIGQTIGILVRDIASALSQPELLTGFTAMFEGIRTAVQALTPIWGPLAQAIGALAPIVGQLATVFAEVIAATASSVIPILEALLPPIQTLISILGDTFVFILQAMEPAITAVATAFANMLNNGGLDAIAIACEAIGQAFVTLAPVIADVATAIFEVLGPVLPVIAQAFADILAAVMPLLPAIGELVAIFVQAFAPILPIIADAITQLVEACAPFVTQIVNVLADILPVVADVFVQILEACQPLVPIIANLVGAIAQLFKALAPIVKELLPLVVPIIEDIVQVLGGVIKVITGIIDFIVGVFTGDWEQAWNGIKDIFSGVWDIITGLLSGIVDVIAGIFEGIWDIITGALDGLIDWFGDLFSDVGDIIGDAIGDIVDWFADLPSKIASGLSNVGRTLLNVGIDLLRGLWDGIVSAADWLWQKVVDFFGSLLPDWVKDILGIESPSKVFAEFGKFVTMGMGVGIADTKAIAGVKSAVTTMTDALVKPVDTDVLKASGVSLMDSFVGGLESRYDAVKDSLKGLAKDVEKTDMGTLTVPVVNGNLTAVAQAAMAGGTVTQNRTLIYNAAPGGGLSSEEDLFSAANRARLGW